jgi:hypothetical protein
MTMVEPFLDHWMEEEEEEELLARWLRSERRQRGKKDASARLWMRTVGIGFGRAIPRLLACLTCSRWVFVDETKGGARGRVAEDKKGE